MKKAQFSTKPTCETIIRQYGDGGLITITQAMGIENIKFGETIFLTPETALEIANWIIKNIKECKK